MFMFLPFLVVLVSAVGALAGHRAAAYFFWLATLFITLGWFAHHATSPLKISF